MENIKKKINNKLNIIDTVEKYIDLNKSGSNYKAICPFHEDNNPSLFVNEEKRIFKCFVCDAGGTAFDFVQKIENLSYSQTVDKLSKQLNIKTNNNQNQKEDSNLNVLRYVNSFYTTILQKSEKGKKARKYLQERKISEKAVAFFQLGFSPPFDEGLQKYLNSKIETDKKYSQINIDNMHVFNEKNYDFFNGRLTIPIFDQYNNLVGFSGRTLEDNTIKYLNSKDNKYFQKKEILYNFNNVINQEISEIIIVEGYFDVINAYQAGIHNIVGTMGVALSEEHIKLLKKRRIKKVILAFDNDDAGFLANQKVGEKLINNGFSVSVLQYGDQKDFDEYINENNEFKIEKMELDYILFILDHYKKQGLNEIEKNKRLPFLRDILFKYNEGTHKLMAIEKLMDYFKVNRSTFEKRQRIFTNNKQNNFTNKINERPSSIAPPVVVPSNTEKIVFYLCTKDKNNYLKIKDFIEQNLFEFKNYNQEFSILENMYQTNNVLNVVDIMNSIESYGEIYDYVQKYELSKSKEKNLEEYMSIEKLITDNKSKNKQMTKLWK